MKKIFTILTVLFATSLSIINAQQTQPQIQLTLQAGQTYSQAVAGSMQPLNTGRIPYGVLYERVVGWAGLTEWSSGDTTNFPHIEQAWWDLENAQTTPINRFDNLKQQIAASLSANKIPLMAISFGFGYVDSLALKDGRIRVENNQIIDAGRASPYLTKKVHLAALSAESVVANTTYQLIAGAPFRLHNLTDETVTGYKVQNLANGQIVSVPLNGSANITFPLTGTNTLKITLNTNKGNYTTYQKISVAPSGATTRSTSATSKDPEDRLLTSAIAFKGYDERTATISHADYHIYYHFTNNDTIASERKLKKPIVILDGFDPQDSRNYAKIYDSLLVYDNKKLGHELRLKGYDVVILNFPMTGTEKEINKTNINISEVPGFSNRDGGTDYIERNAFLLVKLIQELNAELRRNGSNEKLVVVGPSMGGQISRYALAYMEKEQAAGKPNMNHNTRLWVSFDSPHLGANIPLAVQGTLHFFGFAGGQQSAKDGYNKRLHTVAARQMLIEQLSSWGDAIPNAGLNGTASFHTRYYAALQNNGLPNSGGYPKNLRKIALVNGSGSGVLTHAPSSEFLSLDAYKRFIFNIKVAEIKNNFLPQTGNSNRYFKGKVTIRAFLSIIFATGENFVTNDNRRGSMDVVPGGTFDVQTEIKEQFSRSLNNMNIWEQYWNIRNNHCFIPTVSALGFKNANFSWDAKLSDRDLVKSGEIPFDNYYMPSYNQEHVSLTSQSVAWLMRQLDGDYYNQVSEMKITGPSTLCDQATYTIQNLLPGAIVQWSARGKNIALLSGQGTATAVFQQTGFASDEIRAAISLGANVNLSLPVTIRKPYISGASFFCDQTSYIIEKVPQRATVRWEVSPFTIVKGQGTQRVVVKGGSAKSRGRIRAMVSLGGRTSYTPPMESLYVGEKNPIFFLFQEGSFTPLIRGSFGREYYLRAFPATDNIVGLWRIYNPEGALVDRYTGAKMRLVPRYTEYKVTFQVMGSCWDKPSSRIISISGGGINIRCHVLKKVDTFWQLLFLLILCFFLC